MLERQIDRRLRLLERLRRGRRAASHTEKTEPKTTNEANKLMKTNNRVYERTQTKPPVRVEERARGVPLAAGPSINPSPARQRRPLSPP
jgi:hypothetical protein